MRGIYVRRQLDHWCTFPGPGDPPPRRGDIWRCICGRAFERRWWRWVRAAEYDSGMHP